MRNRILDSLDELSRALEHANVPASAKARLLESASVAAYHALTLDELRLERPDVSTRSAGSVQTLERQPLIVELAA